MVFHFLSWPKATVYLHIFATTAANWQGRRFSKSEPEEHLILCIWASWEHVAQADLQLHRHWLLDGIDRHHTFCQREIRGQEGRAWFQRFWQFYSDWKLKKFNFVQSRKLKRGRTNRSSSLWTHLHFSSRASQSSRRCFWRTGTWWPSEFKWFESPLNFRPNGQRPTSQNQELIALVPCSVSRVASFFVSNSSSCPSFCCNCSFTTFYLSAETTPRLWLVLFYFISLCRNLCCSVLLKGAKLILDIVQQQKNAWSSCLYI